ncbi:MAG: dTMP kinase [Balneolaceae bacterium]|nr:dTMP kinase [Balneolaceae bacterium]
MFITFEGIDGSGKSTQIDLLRRHLDDAGERVEVFREPGGTILSEQVRSLLLDPDSRINPVTELLLFSAARSQLMSEKVLPLLEEGAFVILDRFFDSTTAYQGYGRNSLPLEEIERINRAASHHRAPDLTFYLAISLEEARSRTEGMEQDRMERSGEAFYRRVIEGFEELARRENRFLRLDATLPPDELHGRILAAVDLPGTR